MSRKHQCEEEVVALQEAKMRKAVAMAERTSRIRAHAASNPDMTQADIARAFNVGRSVVALALGKRRPGS